MPKRRMPLTVVPEGRSDPLPDASTPHVPKAAFDGRADPQRRILEILAVVREFNDADIAYVGEFREQRQVLRWISGDSASFGFQVGIGVPLEQTYCSELVAGRLPG